MITFALADPAHSGNDSSERGTTAGAKSRRAAEMDQFTPQIAQLIDVAVIVLIPMIPALILYAVLPSRATVSGPFKGLNIRLQGAFGGYFVLVLVVVGVVMEQRLSDDPWPKYETWTVEGHVKFPRDLEDENLLSLEILLEPAPSLPSGGLDAEHRLKFIVKIPVKRTGPAPDSFEIPITSIAFDHPDFHLGNLNFEKEYIVHERVTKPLQGKIIVTDPIELMPKTTAPESREEVEATTQ